MLLYSAAQRNDQILRQIRSKRGDSSHRGQADERKGLRMMWCRCGAICIVDHVWRRVASSTFASRICTALCNLRTPNARKSLFFGGGWVGFPFLRHVCWIVFMLCLQFRFIALVRKLFPAKKMQAGRSRSLDTLPCTCISRTRFAFLADQSASDDV